MAKKIKHIHGRPKKSARVLSRAMIIETSFYLANEVGFENLSMKSIAIKLEIRPPSIYNHVSDIMEIKLGVARLTLDRLAEYLKDSVESKSAETNDKIKILKSLFTSYREFAKKYSGVYSAVLPSAENNPEMQTSSKELIEICMKSLGISGNLDSKAIHKIRILRSTLHGFVSLEAAGGFGLPESVDETFEILADHLVSNLLN